MTISATIPGTWLLGGEVDDAPASAVSWAAIFAGAVVAAATALISIDALLRPASGESASLGAEAGSSSTAGADEGGYDQIARILLHGLAQPEAPAADKARKAAAATAIFTALSLLI